MWGVYARSTHPQGWGNPSGAHGYVLLAVDFGLTYPPVPLLSELRNVPFGQLYHKTPTIVQGWDKWYGGNFDLVLMSDSRPILFEPWGDQNKRTIGDNRAVLVTTLGELRFYGVHI